jgi:N-acetylmuramoyl-L-alanine amidase
VASTRSKTKEIIIHCAATPPGMDIGAKEIRAWHMQKGWSDVGYHFVIRRNGKVDLGRDIGVVGAHAYGHNKESVGICLVGGVNNDGEPTDNFTVPQWVTLEHTVDFLMKVYPQSNVIGHNEISDKACPSFDVRAWLLT